MITVMLILKSKTFKIIERLFIVAAVIVVTAIIVKATDNKFRGRVAGADKSRDGCPMGMIFAPSPAGGFCIDKYEASAGENCPYGNPENQAKTRANLDYTDCLPESKEAVLPWRYISQNQAAIACARAGKRLPTNKEWMMAALGTPDLASGWGEEDCHVNKNWPIRPGFGGSAENCVSAAGAYDMIGNVWEWVDGTIQDGKYKNRSLPGKGYIRGIDEDALPSDTDLNEPDPNYYNDYFWIKSSGTKGMARGGYWGNQEGAGQYSLYMEVPPSYAGDGIGFRCVK